MAVIVVGDIDPKQVQSFIEEEFHDLESDPDAPSREYEKLELHDDVLRCFLRSRNSAKLFVIDGQTERV